MALEFTRKSDFEIHPPGEFRAVFVDWEEDKHEKFGIQAKMSFDTEVLMEDDRNFRIVVWAGPSLHKKSKIAKMLTAFGVDAEKFTDDEVKKFTLDDYTGKKLRLSIIQEPKKGGEPGEMIHRVAAFLPFKKVAVRTSDAFKDEDEEAPPTAPPAAATASRSGKNGTRPAAASEKQSAVATAAPPVNNPFEEEDED